MYSEQYKQKVYKKWLDNGRPWFHIDKSKEPTWEEKQIILEIKKQENTNSRANSDKELERRQRLRPKNEIKEFHRLISNVDD